jgi:hypothetical protein
VNRPLPVLLLTVLLLTSGCSFLGGSASPTATEGSSPTATDAGSPTTTPQQTRTPAPYPPGYGEAGVVDADRAVEAHTDGVADHESFIVEFNGTALSNDRVATIDALQATNLSTERAYTITRVGGRGTTTQYYENGTVYVRTDPPGEDDPEYTSREATFRPRDFTGTNQVEPLVRYVEYGGPERFTRTDGGTFFRYRSSGVENVTNVQAILGESVAPENVTDIEVGLVVGPSGIVHRSAYEATVERGGETLELAIEVNVLGFRSTTVDRPDWFEEAQSA